MVVKKVPQKASKSKNTKISSSTNLNTPTVEPLDRQIDEVIVIGSRARISNNNKKNNGEFRGDFTRDTFDSKNRFSRVLMQQGRVQLDADWNELNSIMLHQLRNLACDIGSEHWGPKNNSGFGIPNRSETSHDFRISPGHYYVNGIFCEIGLNENNDLITYETQPDFPLPDNQTVAELTKIFEASDGDLRALIYLDVWERHVNYIGDDTIREVALGGPDTATRSKTIAQVKVFPVPSDYVNWNNEGNHPLKESYERFLRVISTVMSPGLGTMCAKVKDKSKATDPCITAPESRYRGAENQFYRVEIHNSGVAGMTATYKWSRENSSVIFPILDIQDNKISLEHLGKDCRYGLNANDWVEIVDDDSVLQNRADNLLQVQSIDTENRTVTLKESPEKITSFAESKHPYLRRWDHVDGDNRGLKLIETQSGQSWLELEDGILIKFDSGGKVEDKYEHDNNYARRELPEHDMYRTGDYWLIPARTVTGNIEWPQDSDGKPEFVNPHGIVHHYAPLALLDAGTDNDANGEGIDVDVDLRRVLKQLW